MQLNFRYILERLHEGPTYAGIFVFLSGFLALNFDKAMMDQLAQLGQSLAGVLLMVLPTGGRKAE